MIKKFIINTDGASRGNPGKAAASFVIANEASEILLEKGIYLGLATNNEAEYQAVKNALETLKKTFAKDLPSEILIQADSLLVVSQLSGKYKMKNPRLKIYFDEIKNMEGNLGKVIYKYVPREENKRADYLANLVLDQQALKH